MNDALLTPNGKPRNSSRFSLVALFAGIYLSIAFLTRLGLLITVTDKIELSAATIGEIFLIGAVYDLAFFAFLMIPFLLYLWLTPNRAWNSRWNKLIVFATSYVALFAAGFIVVAEYLFWDEFGARFNFISVDYLVYRQEVSDNIAQSYPVAAILAVLAVISLVVLFALRRQLGARLSADEGFRHRSAIALSLFLVPAASVAFVDQDLRRFTDNNYAVELASDGPYQFFAAFRNNELDYDQFYNELPASQVNQRIHQLVAEPTATFDDDAPYSIKRFIDNPGEEQRLNVVLVTIESLSADFLGHFGRQDNITPNLDALVEKSLFFENFYATGTRTARGLESVTLSMPPTPGRSIVKRIGRESGYFSLGNIFKSKGYDVRFLYGGRGYFDNMNAFFSGNGYEIVDQSSAPASSLSFTNAWGMADEDLYGLSIQAADRAYAQKKPFFFHIMTTSNHRPFTYPDGRIDIPSGTGREGAVKYTDYAIAKLLRDAQAKPWFKDTVFVFLADHCAGSAGKTSLPVERYHIPLWVYAPAHIKARQVDTVASQIDVAPTVLALLNIDYESFFFGRNALAMASDEGRALIGNYQKVGLYENNVVTVLSPVRHTEQWAETTSDAPLLDAKKQHDFEDAVSYYQTADYVFQHQLNRWRTVNSSLLASH